MKIIDVQANTKEWMEHRHRDITASDVAVFFDPKAFKTELGLYYEKRAEHPPEQAKFGDNNFIRMEAGKFLEPFIARMFFEKTGVELSNFKGYARSEEVDRYGATPDNEHPELIEGTILDEVRGNVVDPITSEDGPGIAELKVANTMAWNANYTDSEPPVKYLCQLQQQLDVTGYEWGMIITLIDCNDIDIAVYRRDDVACAAIRQRVGEFWNKVDNNIEPDPSDRDSDATLMRSLYEEYTEEQVDMSGNDKLLKAGLGYITAHVREKAAKKMKGKMRNVLGSKNTATSLAVISL